MKSFEVISELISGQALDLIACKKSMSIRRLFTHDFNFIRIYDYVHIENIKESCNVLCDGRDCKPTFRLLLVFLLSKKLFDCEHSKPAS